MAYGAIQRDAAGNRIAARLFLATSAPGSELFETIVETSDPVASLYDKPAVFPLGDGDGTLLCSYTRYDDSTNQIVVLRLERAADPATAPRTVVGEAATFLDFVNSLHLCPAGGDRVYGASIQASTESRIAFTDPRCVARDQQVFVLYATTDATGGGKEQEHQPLDAIRLARSDDGASSIAERTDVHDPEAGSHFLFPQLAGDARGQLQVIYYAGQGGGDADSTLRWATSTDGTRFGPSQIVHQPLLFELDRSSQTWIGDSDNAAGVAHTAFLSLGPR